MRDAAAREDLFVVATLLGTAVGVAVLAGAVLAVLEILAWILAPDPEVRAAMDAADAADADRALAQALQALHERVAHLEDALVDVDLDLALAEHELLMAVVHAFEDVQRDFEDAMEEFQAAVHAVDLRAMVAAKPLAEPEDAAATDAETAVVVQVEDR